MVDPGEVFTDRLFSRSDKQSDPGRKPTQSVKTGAPRSTTSNYFGGINMKQAKAVSDIDAKTLSKKISKKEALYIDYLRMLENSYGTKIVNPISVYNILDSVFVQMLERIQASEASPQGERSEL